jgi:hypothetical protein
MKFAVFGFFAVAFVSFVLGMKFLRVSSVEYEFDAPSLKLFVKKSPASEREEENWGGRSEYYRLRHANPVTHKMPPNIYNRELAFSASLERFKQQARSAKDKVPKPPWHFAGPSFLGGRTRALALDKSDRSENTILAGGVSGGMWRSEDGAKHWVKTTAPNQLHSVSCVAQDTRAGHEQTWYYGTGEMFSISDLESGLLRGNGIFKSMDGGRSWSVLSSTQTSNPHLYDSPFDYVWNIVINTNNHNLDEIYVAASGGIYRSMTGGDSWEMVLGTGNPSGRYTDIAITSNGTLYATISNINGSLGVDAGIYRSADGKTWENVSPEWWPFTFNRVVIAPCPSNENKIYALADLSSIGSKVHLLASFEISKGWTDLSANLPDYDYYIGDYDSQLSFCMYIKVRPDNENIVFLGGINLYRSTDGFTSKKNTAWVGGYDPQKNDLSKYPNHHPDQHVLLFYTDNNKMLSAHDGGVSLTSSNLENYPAWQSLNANYHTTQFYTIAINQAQDNDALIGGMQDNGTYGTSNSTSIGRWESLLAGDGSFCAISNNGRHIYVSSQYGRIYRQDFDSNGKYIGFGRVDPSAGHGYLFINPFILDPSNSDLMYMGGGSTVWRNDNLTGISSGSDKTTMDGWVNIESTTTNGTISALAISTVPANILYHGTTMGRLYRTINANSDYPATTEITASIFPKYFGNPTGYISSICVDPFDGDNILVTFSNYEVNSIYASADGGSSWSSVGGNLEQNNDGSGDGPAVYWASLLHTSTDIKYFLGTSTGLFTTSLLDGDATSWTNVRDIGTVPVYMVQARQLDGKVVAATHGNGIYQASFPKTLKINFEPLTFSLKQNYPNPFLSSTGTQIPFTIDEQCRVTLMILDEYGREVSSPYNSILKAGNYILESKNLKTEKELSPGIYFYKLTAGQQSDIKRMIVQ